MTQLYEGDPLIKSYGIIYRVNQNLLIICALITAPQGSHKENQIQVLIFRNKLIGI